jgi:hypothetical protein
MQTYLSFFLPYFWIIRFRNYGTILMQFDIGGISSSFTNINKILLNQPSITFLKKLILKQ